MSDYLAEGQVVKVKVLETDDKGRIKLSMKALLDRPAREDGGEDRPPREYREPRGERGDRGPRGARGERGPREDRGERPARAEREAPQQPAPGDVEGAEQQQQQ